MNSNRIMIPMVVLRSMVASAPRNTAAMVGRALPQVRGLFSLPSFSSASSLSNCDETRVGNCGCQGLGFFLQGQGAENV